MLKGLRRQIRKKDDSESFRANAYMLGAPDLPVLSDKRQTKADMKRLVEREERRMNQIRHQTFEELSAEMLKINPALAKSLEPKQKRQTKAEMKRMVAREEREMNAAYFQQRNPTTNVEVVEGSFDDKYPDDHAKRQTKADMKRMVELGERTIYTIPRSRASIIPSEIIVAAGIVLLGTAIGIIGQMSHMIHLAK